MPAYGSSSRGSLVFSEGIKLNFLTILANANLASIKANLIPMHPLGPCPNGKYAYLQRPISLVKKCNVWFVSFRQGSNVEIAVECKIFAIVIFLNCSRVLQFEAHSRHYKGALTQKQSFLVICTTFRFDFYVG